MLLSTWDETESVRLLQQSLSLSCLSIQHSTRCFLLGVSHFLKKESILFHVDQGPNQDGNHHITINYYWVPLVCSPPTSPTYHKWSYWISFLIYFCPPRSTKTDFFFNCLSTLTSLVGSCSKILPAQSHFLLIMGQWTTVKVED